MTGSEDSNRAAGRRRVYDRYVSTHMGDIRPDSLTPSLRAYLRQRIVAHLPRDRGARILDLGCGSGTLLELLGQMGYRAASGVDFSPEQVRRAASRGLHVSEAPALPFLQARPGAFDAIVAIDVLEHLSRSELLETLDAVRASLRPSGTFVAQTVNSEGPFAGRYRYWDLTHETAFTSRSISQALRLTGYEHIRVYEAKPVVHGPVSLVRFVSWQLIRTLLSMYLATETGVSRGHVLTQNLIVVSTRE